MDIFLLFQISAALVGSTVASLFDLRTGKVPNKLSFSMISMGAVLAFFCLEYNHIVPWLLNFAFAFLIAYFVWSINAWGGGDAKLFWAIVSLIPFIPWGGSLSKLTIIPVLILWLACLILLRFFADILFEQLKEKNLQGVFFMFSKPMLAIMFAVFSCVGLAMLLTNSIFTLILLFSVYTTTRYTIKPLKIKLAPYLLCALVLSLIFDISVFIIP